MSGVCHRIIALTTSNLGKIEINAKLLVVTEQMCGLRIHSNDV